MSNPSLIPHSIRSRSTAEIQAEIARIIASTDQAGPVFGEGYSNYRTALRDLKAELATRPAPAAPAPAPALPDNERRDLARALHAKGKTRDQIAVVLGAGRASVDAWLDGPDTDASDDADLPGAVHSDPRQRVADTAEQLRLQVAGGSYKTN